MFANYVSKMGLYMIYKKRKLSGEELMLLNHGVGEDS